jgi:hypothetical protein
MTGRKKLNPDFADGRSLFLARKPEQLLRL